MKQCLRFTFSALVLVLTSCALFPSISLASDCAPIEIAEKLPFKIDPREPLNRGVETDRFLVPSGGQTVLHGVDASKYQDLVDFEEVKRCGGTFAFIRFSAGTKADNELLYRDLWNNARSVGLLAGGYHNLTVRMPTEPLKKIPQLKFVELVELNERLATQQALLYLMRLNELRDLEIVSGTRKRNFSFLPPVLDLSWTPDPKKVDVKSDLFLKIYHSAVCAWVNSVTETQDFRINQVVLFVSEEIYSNMSISQLPCIKKVAGLWVSDRTIDGGTPDYIRVKDSPASKEMCGSGMLPCFFQQYTSHGTFAVFDKKRTIDLNRFFGSETVLRSLLIEEK